MSRVIVESAEVNYDIPNSSPIADLVPVIRLQVIEHSADRLLILA